MLFPPKLATVYTQFECKLEQGKNHQYRGLKMTNPILIHAEQAKGKAFGDSRLVKRGRSCMK